MYKKLMTVAVAGALVMPSMAQAASSGSTVQIYGQAQFEHAYIDQGAGRPSTDYVESTGSFLGFKGMESLGGGLSAWFQCETDMDVRAFDQVGLCSRNSGLGFRGGFGDVFVGRWHTPMSRALDLGDVGGEATGNLGISFLAAGGSGSTSAIATAASPNSGGGAARHHFRRRETCLTTYETPRMGGFMVGAAVSCGNAASEGQATGHNVDGASNQKPRVWSFAGTYMSGPLAAGLSYERHTNMGATAPGARELDDRGWGLSARYTFGAFRIGGIYLDRKWETAVGGDLTKKSGAIGLDWNIAGPHNLHLNYSWLGDTKGSCVGTAAQCSITPTVAGGIAPIGADTGAQSYSIAYQYNFSKRTSAKLGYVRMDNDRNSQAARIGTAATVLSAGDEQDAVALVVKHRF